MKRRYVVKVALLVAFCVIALGLIPGYGDAQGKPQTICPVMGLKIDRNVYSDYQGKRVYFCCQSCKQEFEKNPEKYMKKLEDQGVELENVPK